MSDHSPHPPDPYPLFAGEPRYRVSVCCDQAGELNDEQDCYLPDAKCPDGWIVRFAYTSKWALRKRLRRLYAEGWDKDTILVERRVATMTDDQLRDLIRLSDAATPGPWGVSQNGAMLQYPDAAELLRKMNAGEYPFTCVRVADFKNAAYMSSADSRANAELAAAARNAIRPLCEELLAVRATIAGVRKAAELYTRDNLSANIRMIGTDLLKIITPPAKGE